MNMRLEIDRLEITASGVSPTLVEQALGGLGAELERRLSGGAQRELASRSIEQTSARPIRIGPDVDAHALCALIAERVLAELGASELEAVSQAFAGSPREGVR